MQTHWERERLFDEVIRTTFETTSLNDFSKRGLPLLEQLFDTSTSLIYRGGENAHPIPVAGSLGKVIHEYNNEYLAGDPIRIALSRYKPKLQRIAMLPEWKSYLKSSAYNEFAKPNDIEDFYHVFFGRGVFNGSGTVGIMLVRSKKQPAYEEQDSLMLARMVPALDALVRRDAVMESQFKILPLMETMIELQSPLAVALSLNGKLLWASKKAAALLKLGGGGEKRVLEPLMKAAHGFHDLHEQNFSSSPPPSYVQVSPEGSEPIRVELRLVHTDSGEPFILAEFDPPLYSPLIETLALRYDLTPTEKKVFGLIALGMSNQHIAKHLFVSIGTVCTHVGRILSKLGTSSRVQTALLAHGLPISLKKE